MSRCYPRHKPAPADLPPDPRPDRQAVHYEKVVEGIGAVVTLKIQKGYEYEKGEYVLLEEDELDAVEPAAPKAGFAAAAGGPAHPAAD